jgi:hypothetical protein
MPCHDWARRRAEPVNANSYRLGALAAASTLLGVVLSGPGALLLLEATHPQPPWTDVETFVKHYHPVQSLPFFLGFLLVGGFVTLLAALHDVARVEERARSAAGLVFGAAFSALVFLNYVLQTTLVPELVRAHDATTASLLGVLTMANPRSLAWALEMWGYGLLGLATWLVAPVFEGGPLERATARLFIANGPVSIVPALLTALAPGWELTFLGIVGFLAWNVLVIAMAILAWLVFRRRLAAIRMKPGVRSSTPEAIAANTANNVGADLEL